MSKLVLSAPGLEAKLYKHSLKSEIKKLFKDNGLALFSAPGLEAKLVYKHWLKYDVKNCSKLMHSRRFQQSYTSISSNTRLKNNSSVAIQAFAPKRG